MALSVVMLLALYGCAQAIRRFWLWVTHCPRSVDCYRVYIPRGRVETEPLVRCLQTQAVWGEEPARALILVPPGMTKEEFMRGEDPVVLPVTPEELAAMLGLPRD